MTNRWKDIEEEHDLPLPGLRLVEGRDSIPIFHDLLETVRLFWQQTFLPVLIALKKTFALYGKELTLIGCHALLASLKRFYATCMSVLMRKNTASSGQDSSKRIYGLSVQSAISLRKIQGTLTESWSDAINTPLYNMHGKSNRWADANRRFSMTTAEELLKTSWQKAVGVGSNAPAINEQVLGLDDIFTGPVTGFFMDESGPPLRPAVVETMVEYEESLLDACMKASIIDDSKADSASKARIHHESEFDDTPHAPMYRSKCAEKSEAMTASSSHGSGGSTYQQESSREGIWPFEEEDESSLLEGEPLLVEDDPIDDSFESPVQALNMSTHSLPMPPVTDVIEKPVTPVIQEETVAETLALSTLEETQPIERAISPALENSPRKEQLVQPEAAPGLDLSFIENACRALETLAQGVGLKKPEPAVQEPAAALLPEEEPVAPKTLPPIDSELQKDLSACDYMVRNNRILSNSISNLVDSYFQQAELEEDGGYY